MAPHPLHRLAASGLAYQSSSLLAGVLALVTLPLYTAHLGTAELGAAENLLTWIILVSILLRAGLQEALLRHWFLDGDAARRARLARRVTAVVLAASTALGLLAVLLAEPLSRALLGDELPAGERTDALRAAAVGVWAFTNLEVANALLRAQERRRTYLLASLTNVVLTVATTVVLVVALDGGTTGYLLGNYLASTVVLLGVWWAQRDVFAGGHGAPATPLRPLLRFGLPTVPPEVAVFLLNVVDRTWLTHAAGDGLDATGVYSAAVQLATLVIVVARAFQAAWPPLAYDLSAEEAPRAYALVVRAYVVVLGTAVAALVLLRHQLVDVLVDAEFAAAAGALPWLALGWALWGLTWVFTTIAGREHATGRTLPAALLGLAVNVLALWLLVPPYGATGAAIALVAAYVVALGASHLRTRRLMAVPFEWSRLATTTAALTVYAVGIDWLVPAGGAEGWILRIAAALALPVVLLACGAVRPAEARALAGAVARRRGR